MKIKVIKPEIANSIIYELHNYKEFYNFLKTNLDNNMVLQNITIFKD